MVNPLRWWLLAHQGFGPAATEYHKIFTCRLQRTTL